MTSYSHPGSKVPLREYSVSADKWVEDVFLFLVETLSLQKDYYKKKDHWKKERRTSLNAEENFKVSDNYSEDTEHLFALIEKEININRDALCGYSREVLDYVAGFIAYKDENRC